MSSSYDELIRQEIDYLLLLVKQRSIRISRGNRTIPISSDDIKENRG